MINQLSSTCYEWNGGNFDVTFLEEGVPPKERFIPSEFQSIPKPAIAPQSTMQRFTREQIRPIQVMVAPILAKWSTRFELCGSYRRGKNTVKDMDYVVECSKETFLNIRTKLSEAGIDFHRGATEIMNGRVGDIGIDFFRADPASYITILIWRTGSARHNIYCASIAKKKGMKILRTGLRMRDGTVFNPRTEKEFYMALGIRFRLPCERDMAW
jgi:DNA polymerase/3'-5' exonuclease PolX